VRTPRSRLLAAAVTIGLAATAAVSATPAGATTSTDNAVVTLSDGTQIGTLDTTTGATSNFVGPNHFELWGDAFSTDGNLYGIEGMGQLVRIDQATGASTNIGTNHGVYYGLDQAPDGTMYSASYGGPSGAGLYTIDTTTGDVHFVGSSMGAMDVSFDCSGTLWGIDAGKLSAYDLTTGAITRTITLTGYANTGMLMGLFADAHGDMLATSYESPGKLFKVDMDTGALTLIGNTNHSAPHGGDDASACTLAPKPTTLTAVAGSSTYGQDATLTATLGAGSSGLDGETVAFSVNGTSVGSAVTDSSGIATLAGVDTTALDAGGYTGDVTASFAGHDLYVASSGTGDLTVAPAAQTVAFTTTPPTASVGGSYAAAATGGQSGEPVLFSADAATTNDACTVSATGAVAFQHPGSCVVDADQAGTDNYTAAATVQQTIAVGTATTTLHLAVGAHDITATVAPASAGAVTPSGDVTFSVGGNVVGTAALDANGVARLSYTVPTGATREVAASYLGDDDFTGSVDSTSRTDPKIRATVTSTRHKSAHGWYAGPVTVRFSCSAGSARLTSPCPAPVRLARSAAGQSVTRTITTTDGGAAIATVSHINIDRSKPRVRVVGVRKHAVYLGSHDKPRCAATDPLSGVVRCTVRVHSRNGVNHYKVTATNGAGLSATRRGSYRVLRMWIQGHRWHKGHFDVRAGQTVTVVVASKARPRYQWATPVTRHGAKAPHGGNTAFNAAGPGRWRIPVRLDAAMPTRYPQWKLGARVGGKQYVIRIAFRG